MASTLPAGAPVLGGSINTWGAELNANTAKALTKRELCADLEALGEDYDPRWTVVQLTAVRNAARYRRDMSAAQANLAKAAPEMDALTAVGLLLLAAIAVGMVLTALGVIFANPL